MVCIETEEYTTQTCTYCGLLNKKIGGDKIITCKDCKMSVDRDYVGARNILLRFIKRLYSITEKGIMEKYMSKKMNMYKERHVKRRNM
jgi:ribosomal protein L37AE/L43A